MLFNICYLTMYDDDVGDDFAPRGLRTEILNVTRSAKVKSIQD